MRNKIFKLCTSRLTATSLLVNKRLDTTTGPLTLNLMYSDLEKLLFQEVLLEPFTLNVKQEFSQRLLLSRRLSKTQKQFNMICLDK